MRRRLAIWERYHKGLRELEEAGHVRLPRVPADCGPNGHLFYVLLQDVDARTRLIAHLRDHGILAVFHFVPLHTAPMGRRLCDPTPSLPVTEAFAERLLRLPVFFELTEAAQDRVIEAVKSFWA